MQGKSIGVHPPPPSKNCPQKITPFCHPFFNSSIHEKKDTARADRSPNKKPKFNQNIDSLVKNLSAPKGLPVSAVQAVPAKINFSVPPTPNVLSLEERCLSKLKIYLATPDKFLPPAFFSALSSPALLSPRPQPYAPQKK